METKKPHSKTIPDDILYHFELILIDLERLKLDYNRDAAIVHGCDNLIHKILLTAQLYERYDRPIFRAVKNKINELVSTKYDLRGIILHIENTRCESMPGSIEKFKISI